MGGTTRACFTENNPPDSLHRRKQLEIQERLVSPCEPAVDRVLRFAAGFFAHARSTNLTHGRRVLGRPSYALA